MQHAHDTPQHDTQQRTTHATHALTDNMLTHTAHTSSVTHCDTCPVFSNLKEMSSEKPRVRGKSHHRLSQGRQVPRHLTIDARDWMNEIPTVPIC